MSMQLRAPRHEGPPKILTQQEEVEVSYAIAARPLSSGENGSSSSIVRVRVTLLSPDGKPVTPNTVVLDLLSPPDGSHHIIRVRLEPAKCHRGNHRNRHRPWQMKFWRAQIDALLKGLRDKQASSLSSGAEHDVKPSNAQNPADTPDSASDSQTGFIFSPYWSPTYSRPSDQQVSGTFMRLVRPVILPALLGTAASLVACLIGFVIGQLFMSISMRLGFRKKQEQQHRRSRMIAVEEGTLSEKTQLVPTIYVTEADTDGLRKGTAF